MLEEEHEDDGGEADDEAEVTDVRQEDKASEEAMKEVDGNEIKIVTPPPEAEVDEKPSENNEEPHDHSHLEGKISI